MRRSLLIALWITALAVSYAAYGAAAPGCAPKQQGGIVGGSPAPAAHPIIDPRAAALLDRVLAHLRSIRTLSAVCTHTSQRRATSQEPHGRIVVEAARIRLMRPGFAHIETSLTYRDASGRHKLPVFRTYASDGATSWRVYNTGEYIEARPAPDVLERDLGIAAPLYGFFDPDDFVTGRITLLRQEGLIRALQYGGATTRNGASYQVVRLAYQQMGSHIIVTEDYSIGADLFIHRIETAWSDGIRLAVDELTDIRANAPMTSASFAYKLPANAHRQAASPDQPSTGLANGSVAPDFTVQGADGKPVRLSDYRGKVVVLDFWATWCGPCTASLPHTNAIAKRYRAGNAVVLAIDVGDSPQVFHSWLQRHTEYDAVVFAIDPRGIAGDGIDTKLYRGGALPTQIVIDPGGKIAASFVGYDGKGEESLEQAIKSAGGS